MALGSAAPVQTASLCVLVSSVEPFSIRGGNGRKGKNCRCGDLGLSVRRVNLCYYRIAIKRYRKYILFLAIISLVLSGVVVMSKVRYGTPRYLFSFILNPSRQNIPNKQTAAVLILTPQTEKVYVGETLSATLILDTPDKPVNMVEARIIFPTDKMEVTSLSKVGSIISLWAEEPAYSNATGTYF